MQVSTSNISKVILGLLFLFGEYFESYAQENKKTDSVFFLAKEKGLLGKIGKSLSVNNNDLIFPINGASKSEFKYNPFKGKIIREITIEKIGFDKSVNDSTKHSNNIFNKIGDALHSKTKKRVIVNNLFFTKGDSLYPALLADNERFLRELTYLQDARILVNEIKNNNDSVDIIIVCKDIFPIGGSIEPGSTTNVSFEINDDNIAGTANRFQFQNYFDINRNPGYGFGLGFLKRNFLGTFINFSVGYQNQAPSYSSNEKEEKAIYVKGELPLVSPYHLWTGAFEIGSHNSQNAYWKDSLYNSDLKYQYRLLDGWIGYNIGAKSKLTENLTTRLRRLIAIRGTHRVFSDIPNLYKNNYNIFYSDLVSILSSFTIFEQDYYYTNFLYGFGRNEDVPEGFNLSVTGGWANRNNISRPYMGFNYQRFYFSNKKNYLNYTLQLGGYYNQSRIEDISFFTSLAYFTKLRKIAKSRWLIRHFLNGSFTQLINTYLNEPLRLSSDFGIPELNNPDLKASTRFTFNGESVFYNTWKFLGFSFAPFAFTNITFLKPIGGFLQSGDAYTAIGTGVRTRNENLVFGTIECKVFYYPRTTGTMSQWNFTLSTGLKFRYESQLVKKPDFVVVN